MRAIVFALILISPFLYSADIEFDKEIYEKGEQIVAYGICENEKENLIRATYSRNGVFNKDIRCENGNFRFVYTTSFLDPSGKWKIEVLPGKIGREIEVRPIQQSSYYKITLLSPSVLSIPRGEGTLFKVLIEDEGKKVDDATVNIFDIEGNRFVLEMGQKGEYAGEYFMPLQASTGVWEAIVLVTKNSGNETFGGERKFPLTVERANILLNVEEPSKDRYEQTDIILFSLTAGYKNGAQLSKNDIKKIEATVNTQIVQLGFDEISQKFTGAYTTEKDGSYNITIMAQDEYGNSGEKTIEVFVSCSALCTIKKNLVAIILLIVIALIGAVLYPKLAVPGNIKKLKEEKIKLNEKIQDLQNDYFKRGAGAKDYKDSMQRYNAKIAEIEEDIERFGNSEKHK